MTVNGVCSHGVRWRVKDLICQRKFDLFAQVHKRSVVENTFCLLHPYAVCLSLLSKGGLVANSLFCLLQTLITVINVQQKV